ncbi:hypothetical protein [Endozoicomonas sp. Mp262]|uniref:hypothetical protein n=1 Tax=Endozoicomonas sp. Mp262 TaxID=2919499 RepID=UPI0021DAE0FC
MDIRKDLEPVDTYIYRLLEIADQFNKNVEYWSHLKNKEDFREVMQIPESERYKVEKVYSDGKDMALFMKSALFGINHDFSEYPTLTSITRL